MGGSEANDRPGNHGSRRGDEAVCPVVGGGAYGDERHHREPSDDPWGGSEERLGHGRLDVEAGDDRSQLGKETCHLFVAVCTRHDRGNNRVAVVRVVGLGVVQPVPEPPSHPLHFGAGRLAQGHRHPALRAHDPAEEDRHLSLVATGLGVAGARPVRARFQPPDLRRCI